MIEIKNIEKAMDVQFSEEQLNVLRSKGGLCVSACAGSGKTTILTSLLAKRILTGEIPYPNKILCTTYSKSGALELELRANQLLRQCGKADVKLSVKTLHAVYYRILKAFNVDFTIMSEEARLATIKECYVQVLKKHPDEETLKDISTLFSYQVNNMLNGEKLFHSSAYRLDLSLEQYSSLRAKFSQKKEERGYFDFDDMQVYLFTLLRKPDVGKMVKDYCHKHWEYYFVDESQDMSTIQYCILRQMVTDKNHIVFVGDEDQCIYEWRGANPSLLMRIVNDYQLNRLALSTNYRCSSNIIALAKRGISCNTNRYEKEMVAYNKGGRVRIIDVKASNLFKISRHALAHILKLVNAGEKPDTIAVLVRNNQYGSLLTSMLFKNGIYSEYASEISLSSSQEFSCFLDMVRLLNDPLVENVGNIFWRLFPYMAVKHSSVLHSVGTSQSYHISQLLHRLQSNSRSNNKEQHQLDIIRGNLSNDAWAHIRALLNIIENKDSLVESDRFVKVVNLYVKTSAFMLAKSSDKIRFLEGCTQYLQSLLKAQGIDQTLKQFRAFRQCEKSISDVGVPTVKIMTMHSCKGKEWKHVVLLADDNMSLPSFNELKKDMERNIPCDEIDKRIEEGRRLHYVSMTRAKSNLVVLTNSSDTGCYLLESMGILSNKSESANSNNAFIRQCAKQGTLPEHLLSAARKLYAPTDSLYYYDRNNVF